MALVPKALRPAPLVRADDDGWAIVAPARPRSFTEDAMKEMSESSAPLDWVDDAVARTRAANERPRAAEPHHAAQTEMREANRTEIQRLPPRPSALQGEGVDRAVALRDEESSSTIPARNPYASGMEAEARFICDTLRLFHLCHRADCRRARRCRGHSRPCLDLLGEHAPAEAHEWVEALVEAGKTGETIETVQAMHWEEYLAFQGWLAGVAAPQG